MSEGLGRKNLSGSAATSPARSSLAKPKPIVVSSRLNATYTIRPTRNLTRSWIRCSVVRGSVRASARTSSTITTPSSPSRPSDTGTSASPGEVVRVDPGHCRTPLLRLAHAPDAHLRLAPRPDLPRPEPTGRPGGRADGAGRPGGRAPGRRRADLRGPLRPGGAAARGRADRVPDPGPDPRRRDLGRRDRRQPRLGAAVGGVHRLPRRRWPAPGHLLVVRRHTRGAGRYRRRGRRLPGAVPGAGPAALELGPAGLIRAPGRAGQGHGPGAR